MRALIVSLALALCLGACSKIRGSEDDAYDLAKAQAKKDLGCDDVLVKKMAQTGDAYEYQASGCSDVYSYGITCEGGCRVVAGVRGPGLGGMWNKTASFIDRIADDITEADARQKKMQAEHDAMREEIRAQQEETLKYLRR